MTEKEEFIRQVREIQPKFTRFYVRLLTQAQLSFPQFAVLTQLVNRGRVSMSEVSEKLHISKPAVTHLVDRLEKNKFLKRLPHPDDRRISLLQILPKGENVVRTTQGQALGFLVKTLEVFNAEEKKTIARFYGRLSQTLDQALMETKKTRK